MWKYLLKKLIKWPNKGWFQEKQPLCLDNRKGKTESPHCFPNLSQKFHFLFSLYISVKGALFWDAAVTSIRAVSANWYVISSCSVDSKIKTEEFCNFIIKKLDLEDAAIPLRVMYFVFANWIKVKTWTWGYHHWMTCRRMTCLREFGKQQQVPRWLCAFLAHQSTTTTTTPAPDFLYHTQPRVYHRTPSFLGIP